MSETLRRGGCHPMSVWISCCLLMLTAVTLVGCSPDATDPVPYSGSWEYRWGDSPRGASGELAWASERLVEGRQDPSWRPCTLPGSPAGRADHNSLWLRTQLTGPQAHEPTLFLLVVDQILEAYLDGKLVYRFGVLDGPGADRFQGYRPHFIPLGNGYQGKTLALRIHSRHANIGVAGSVQIGDRLALTIALMRRGQDKLFVGGLLLVLGLAALGLYAVRRSERIYRAYAGFAVSIGIYMIAQSESRTLLLDTPLLWVYVELFSLYLVPPFLFSYMRGLLGRGPFNLTAYLIWLHWAYFAGVVLLVGTGAVPIMATWLPFTLWFMFDVIYFMGVTLIAVLQDDQDARIFGTGVALAGVLALYDILTAMGLLPRRVLTVSHIGLALFVISLGVIPIRRIFLLQKQLNDYSLVLQLSLSSANVMDLGQYARDALDELIALLGLKRALLFLVRGESAALDQLAGRNDQKQDLVSWQSFDAQTIEQVRKTQRPILEWRQTSEESTRMLGAAQAGRQIACLAAPLLIRDRLLGVLYLETERARRAVSQGDRAILLGLCGQIAIAIHTARSVHLEVENAVSKRRVEEQQALLDGAVRMASGDLSTPIASGEKSGLRHLAEALDKMRRDLQAKFQQLEQSNAKVRSLNEELLRQIEQRSRRLLEAILVRKDDLPKSAPPLTPGTLFGEVYQVVRSLGQGAMGAVYEVERTTDHQRLALKVLTGQGDRTALVRFAREAQLLAKVSHPNLIGIADVDVTASGMIYIVMEMVAGSTLRQLRSRYGELAWALSVLRQIAEALAALHERDIIHRDLKPANILTGDAAPGQPPVVKVADMGISVIQRSEEPLPAGKQPSPLVALMAGEEDSLSGSISAELEGSPAPHAEPAQSGLARSDDLTETGMIVGTPMYIAPELAVGSRQARPSSDVFSFGVIAYELLTKELPFQKPALVLSLRTETLVLPMGIRKRGDVEPSLLTLFERCLSIDPNQRPTARELSQALSKY